MWSVPRLHNKIPSGDPVLTRVEAASNTSTVTLRVVGGDKKGSLKSETVKYGRKSQGTRTEKTALARASGTYKRQTRPLVREGAPQNQERNCQTYSVFRAEIKIWSQAPNGCFIPRQTGQLTVDRNIRLRLRPSAYKRRE
jgi:hypothetical protein